MTKYNYCCLFSKNDSCKQHGKMITKEGKEDDTQPCEVCGSDMKQLGISTNICHIGTQESKTKHSR